MAWQNQLALLEIRVKLGALVRAICIKRQVDDKPQNGEIWKTGLKHMNYPTFIFKQFLTKLSAKKQNNQVVLEKKVRRGSGQKLVNLK